MGAIRSSATPVDIRLHGVIALRGYVHKSLPLSSYLSFRQIQTACAVKLVLSVCRPRDLAIRDLKIVPQIVSDSMNCTYCCWNCSVLHISHSLERTFPPSLLSRLFLHPAFAAHSIVPVWSDVMWLHPVVIFYCGLRFVSIQSVLRRFAKWLQNIVIYTAGNMILSLEIQYLVKIKVARTCHIASLWCT
jgi:hypothetical protein